MHPILNVAIQAIRKAGNFIIQQYEFFNQNKIKPLNNIELLISKIHNESNHIITTTIKKFYPKHTIHIYPNYNAHNIHCDNNTHWIIEPIDNNTNFIKQFPFFALSIAVQYKKHIEVEVIYDPIHNELFSACRGKGAQFNGYRIRINNTLKNLNGAILAITFTNTKRNIAINILNQLYSQYTIDFRRTGSVALDLVYITIGRIDGCYILTEKQTNKLASGALIVQESGGFLINLDTEKTINEYPYYGNIVAGNSKITKSLLTIIQDNL